MGDDSFSAGFGPVFSLRLIVPEGIAPLRLDAALALARPDLGLRARRRLWTWCRITVNGLEQPPGRLVRAGDEIAVAPREAFAPAVPAPAATLSGASVPAASEVATKAGLEAVPEATPEVTPEVVTEAAPKALPQAATVARQAALVAVCADYYALYKPEGLHSAALAGGNEASLESLLPRLWPHMAAPPLELPQRLLTRLDKATSGLVLAARSDQAAGRFRELEEQGRVRKVYCALVRGHVPGRLELKAGLRTDNRAKSLVLDTDSPDAARHTLAVPLCRALFVAGQARPAADGPFTLLRVEIRRGARHQIRAHLAAAGYPLAGEDLYAEALSAGNNPGLLCLHHARLSVENFTAACRPGWLAAVSEAEYEGFFAAGT